MRGKLAAFTSIVVGPAFMAKERFFKNNPYMVGVVELEEGAKIVGRITGKEAKKPCGIQVKKKGSPINHCSSLYYLIIFVCVGQRAVFPTLGKGRA